MRETLVGLAVLGLVLAGAFWARGRSDSSSDTGAESAMPDVTVADGTVAVGDVRVTLAITPRPPVAFARHRFRVRVESDGAPRALEDGRIVFEMAMPMGEHRYALVPVEEGWQEAEVVLPWCQFGKRRWYVSVEGTVAGQRRVAHFRLDLAPPGAVSS